MMVAIYKKLLILVSALVWKEKEQNNKNNCSECWQNYKSSWLHNSILYIVLFLFFYIKVFVWWWRI